jgi:hypothetical protein
MLEDVAVRLPLNVVNPAKIFAAGQLIRHTTRPEQVLVFKPTDSV